MSDVHSSGGYTFAAGLFFLGVAISGALYWVLMAATLARVAALRPELTR